MRLFATQNVTGTLESQPDPRLAPTAFAEMSDARADSIGAKLDAFLEATGLSRNQASTALSLTPTPAVTVAPTPFYKTPAFVIGAAIVGAYFLHKEGVI